MSASEYNLPLHVRAASENPDEYGLENGYHTGGVSPTGLGGWDGQGDGGGKFRLKRRRRCGQCGPCLVKENCNKCQYCMRKDVLKQACIYRKCVYLRKPVPRFRQDPPLTSSVPGKTVSPITNGKPPVLSNQQHQQQPPTPQQQQHHHSQSVPPPSQQQQPPSNHPMPQASSTPTPSSNNNNNNSNSNSGLSSVPSNPSPLTKHPSHPTGAPPPPSHHSSEYSSCRLNQSPFMAMQPRGPVFESNSTSTNSSNGGSVGSLTPHSATTIHSKSSEPLSRFGTLPVSSVSSNPYPSKLDQATPSLNHTADLNSAAAAAAAAASPLNGMNASLSHPHAHHATASKGPASLTGRDSYFSSMDPWNAMPYSFPRAAPGAWSAGSTLTNPHAHPHHHHTHHAAAAAAYGFQQPHTAFPASFTPSSCRLGLQDQANPHFSPTAGSHQHSFHAGVTGMTSFTQDLSAHATNSNLRSTVNPAFYPTASHLPPATIPSFPSLTQFHSAATAPMGFQPSSYSMHPHHHMYPGGFYSSFRTPTEPQIYHAQIALHQNPFKDLLTSVEKEILDISGKSKDHDRFQNNASFIDHEILLSSDKHKDGKLAHQILTRMEDKFYLHPCSKTSTCCYFSNLKRSISIDLDNVVNSQVLDSQLARKLIPQDYKTITGFQCSAHIPSTNLMRYKKAQSCILKFNSPSDALQLVTNFPNYSPNALPLPQISPLHSKSFSQFFDQVLFRKDLSASCMLIRKIIFLAWKSELLGHNCVLFVLPLISGNSFLAVDRASSELFGLLRCKDSYDNKKEPLNRFCVLCLPSREGVKPCNASACLTKQTSSSVLRKRVFIILL